MTDFQGWDKKAKEILKEDSEDEKEQKKASDAALGIKEGAVEGPPVAKAQKEKEEMEKLTKERKAMIERMSKTEETYDQIVDNEYTPPQNRVKKNGLLLERICVDDEVKNESPREYASKLRVADNQVNIEANGKAIKIVDAKNSTINITGMAIKIFVSSAENCTINVKCPVVVSSSAELWQLKKTKVNFGCSMQSVQVDGCLDMDLHWNDELSLEFIICHACDDVRYHLGGVQHTPKIVNPDGKVLEDQSMDPEVQYVTKYEQSLKALVCAPVHRHAEKEFPTFLTQVKVPENRRESGASSAAGNTNSASSSAGEQEGESKEVGGGEASLEDLKAIALKSKDDGNAAFRANDFLQAAVFYTMSIQQHADPVVYANRAQCWLKTGDFEKAVADCKAALELDANNAKAHFRLGMALHGQDKYEEALQSLGRAEKLDPKNKQISEAIGMVSIKQRRVRAKQQSC